MEGNYISPSKTSMTIQAIMSYLAIIMIGLFFLSIPYFLYINYEKLNIVLSNFNIDQSLTIRGIIVALGILFYILSLVYLFILAICIISRGKDIGEPILAIGLFQIMSFLCFLLHN